MSCVDVIVPCYRYGHFLRECVNSVLTQSLSTVRVLIIDDASPDNTAEVAEELCLEDSRVELIRHNDNKGHIYTYNEGIDWASSDYVLLLSADDYLLPGALIRATGLMDNHPQVGFTFGSAMQLTENGLIRSSLPIAKALDETDTLILTGREFIEVSAARNIVPTPTALVRTELQKAVGGYRPELPHAGDMEMWLRLAAHGFVGVIKAYQAVYRVHKANMSHDYYEKDWWMSDLQQRRAAIRLFFENCGYEAMSDAPALYSRTLWFVSRDAIGYASHAFNEGAMDACEQLIQFAVETCPQIKFSLPWAKISCKRRLGLTAWRSAQPFIQYLRRVIYAWGQERI
jgi:glycosyltransferase involved in cell wall biosynthesis